MTPFGLSYDLQIENESLAVRLLEGPRGAFWTLGQVLVSADAFAIEVDGRIEGINDNVSFGFHPGQQDGIRFNIQPGSRQYHLFDSTGGPIVTLALATSSAIAEATAANHLRMEWRGAEVKIFLNGRLVDETVHPLAESRPVRVGLGVGVNRTRGVRSEDGLKVLFDNFRVIPLEP